MKITDADFQWAANIAECAEEVAFSGNDIAGLRNRICGDSEIQKFVDLIRALRIQARKEALEDCRRMAIEELCDNVEIMHLHDGLDRLAKEVE